MIVLITLLPAIMVLTMAFAHIDIDTDSQEDNKSKYYLDLFKARVNRYFLVKVTHGPRVTPLNSYEYRRVYYPEETVKIQHYPFMAAVLVNREMWCSGVVFRPNMVLAAANCLKLQYHNRFFREYIKMVSVRVGSSVASTGGQVYHASDLYFHPNFKPQTLENNLVLIRLVKYINFFKKNVPVAVIPHTSDAVAPGDRNITFLGWGSVASPGKEANKMLLQKIELPVYNLADCQDVYGEDLVTRTNFCVGYISMLRNICNHDAGGPAILDGVLLGMLSFSNARCDELDKPAVFTSVGANVRWLESEFKQSNESLKLFN